MEDLLADWGSGGMEDLDRVDRAIITLCQYQSLAGSLELVEALRTIQSRTGYSRDLLLRRLTELIKEGQAEPIADDLLLAAFPPAPPSKLSAQSREQRVERRDDDLIRELYQAFPREFTVLGAALHLTGEKVGQLQGPHTEIHRGSLRGTPLPDLQERITLIVPKELLRPKGTPADAPPVCVPEDATHQAPPPGQPPTQRSANAVDGGRDHHLPDYMKKIRLGNPRAWVRWTEAEDEKLRGEVEAGFVVSEIAQRHQRQASAIWSRLKKLSIRPRVARARDRTSTRSPGSAKRSSLGIGEVFEGRVLLDIYWQLKERSPQSLVFLQGGSFFNVFEEDAERCAALFGWKTFLQCGQAITGFPMQGVKPFESLEEHGIPYLIAEDLPEPPAGRRRYRCITKIWDPDQEE